MTGRPCIPRKDGQGRPAKRSRRHFLKTVGLGSVTAAVLSPAVTLTSAGARSGRRGRGPNVVILMTDQQRADLSKREGFLLDTTPFLDGLARSGVWFDRAYTTMPVCVPARTSLLTGRYPSATRVRTNHNVPDATYTEDLVDVFRAQGYTVGFSGKNHSYLRPDRCDHFFFLWHEGGRGPDRTAAERAFDAYLDGLKHGTARTPTPFPLACQCPYRAVSSAQEWIEGLHNADGVLSRPFLLWLSFPEPHSPYQVPEPYYSMFPPDTLPRTRADASELERKGFKFAFTRALGEQAFPDYAEQIPRARANYLGMLRLIDDQVKRFVGFLEARDLMEDTILVFVSDHGDFAGEYGLMRKGPELPESLTRIPLFFTGAGIRSRREAHPAHVSIADIMPTLCEAVGASLPEGVQGRSLWPLIRASDREDGEAEWENEFASAYAEQGFGGRHYSSQDGLDPVAEGALEPGVRFDCLNSWSQSGTMRMVRQGKWKLVFDMQGEGQLYDLSRDPAELENLFGRKDLVEKQAELTAELLAWTLRVQDPLPLPRRRYVMKTDPRNYWAPYRREKR